MGMHQGKSLSGSTGALLLHRRTKLVDLPISASSFVLSRMRIFCLQEEEVD